LIRRRVLVVLDTGSASLAAGNARVLTSYVQGEEQGSQHGESVSTSGKTGGKPTSVQPIEFSDTDKLILSEGFRYVIIRCSGDPLTANQVSGDHNDYVAYFPVDALKCGEESEDGIHWVKHVYIDPMFWSDYTDPESQTKKTKEQIAREKAGRLARVKRILAASTRQDWEADGPRLWVRKGATQLKIVDLTEDEGRVEIDKEWARNAGVGSVALRVELSICQGSDLLAKVPTACVDSGRAYIPWPHEDEDGRLVVARWQYDLCRVISPGEYLGAYPVRSYLQRAGIVVN
jgi:secreted PhoX family phosphatase